jgi:hypothetical protein
MHGGIRSLGLPPERHADRIVAEMLREVARTHSTLWDAIEEVVAVSRGGSPKAQRKLAERILRAGAIHTKLWPGKRGKYQIMIYDFTGFDPSRDAEIGPDDPIPEKPWISCNLSLLESPGGGRNVVEINSRPLLFITHHALSRGAQRLGMRTSAHMTEAARIIWNSCVKLLNDKGDIEQWLDAPPQGWRVPIPPMEGAVAVLKRHEKRRALVAATVIIG